jgi:hypothetical protein
MNQPTGSARITESFTSGLAESAPVASAPAEPLEEEDPELEAITDEVLNTFSQLRRLRAGGEFMGVSKFLHPADENVEDSLEDVEAHIISVYQEHSKNSEDDEPEPAEPETRISIREAAGALEKLSLFESQQIEEYRDTPLAQALHNYREKLNRRRLEIQFAKVQSRLEDFWGPRIEHLPVREQVAQAKAAYQETLESGSEMLHDSDFERLGMDPPARSQTACALSDSSEDSDSDASDILVCHPIH